MDALPGSTDAGSDAVGTSKARQSIQSVARASRILLAIARSPRGLTASEVASGIGLTMSTAYHLLSTLEDEHLVIKEQGRRYALGSGAVEIANAPGLRARAEPRHRQALEQLAATTRETAYLTGWFRGEIRILAMVEGSQAVRVAGLEVGYTGAVHARASAKVLLAFTDDAQRSLVLDGHEFTPFTSMTVRDRAALDAQMVEIRRTGIMYDEGEYREDVCFVSAPIRRDGRVVAALAVVAPSSRYAHTKGVLASALLSAVAFAGAGG